MLNPHTKLNAFSALDHILHWNNHRYMIQMLYISTSVLHLSYVAMVQESSSSIISLTPLTSIYIIWHCDLSCGLLFATNSPFRILGTVGGSLWTALWWCCEAASSPQMLAVPQYLYQGLYRIKGFGTFHLPTHYWLWGCITSSNHLHLIS